MMADKMELLSVVDLVAMLVDLRVEVKVVY